MKLTISKTELVTALDIVIKATSSRASVPALAGILISTEQDIITFFATDFETSIKTAANGMVDEQGTLAVPGKIFSSLVKSLPEAAVTLETSGDLLSITCNQVSYSLKTIDTTDFTRFPDITGIESVELPTEVLDGMVRKVSKAVSHDDTRAILTGILFKIEKEIVKMVATDSYRLALVERYLEEPVIDSFEILVPGKAFEEVIRMSVSSETIKITITSNQILFTFKNTSYVTRRLDGNFPNFGQLIPKEWKARLTANTAELSESVKRVSLMALNNTAVKLTCSVEDQELSLSAKAQDVGEASEKIAAKIEGESKEISFNHTFIQDGLSVIEKDTVYLEIQDAMKPGLLRSPDEGFTYLMMPVRSNQ